jgi:hypothetical protein
MINREIPKLITPPLLNDKIVKLLTKLCFREDCDTSSYKADTIFMFGTTNSMELAAKKLIMLIEKINPSKLILTGGIPHFTDSASIIQPESEAIYNIIKDYLPASLSIILEKKSTSCLENVIFSLDKINDLNCENIIFFTKSFAAGRCYMTLKKYISTIPLLQLTYNPFYPEIKDCLSKDNWFKNEYSINRIWAEYIRIKTYGKKGDIKVCEMDSIIKKIDKLLH